MPQSDGISLTDTTGTGSIYAMIHIANQYGFDYVQQLYVGDKTVFCIEPMQLFTEGLDYHRGIPVPSNDNGCLMCPYAIRTYHS